LRYSKSRGTGRDAEESGFANRHTEETAQIVRRDFVTEGGENGEEHAEYVLWDAEEGREGERGGVYGVCGGTEGCGRGRGGWRCGDVRERESRKTGAGWKKYV
jgi:hypothetical protein